ncbi:MAG: hypothetical protein ACK56F_31175, partial [bacterium]
NPNEDCAPVPFWPAPILACCRLCRLHVVAFRRRLVPRWFATPVRSPRTAAGWRLHSKGSPPWSPLLDQQTLAGVHLAACSLQTRRSTRRRLWCPPWHAEVKLSRQLGNHLPSAHTAV